MDKAKPSMENSTLYEQAIRETEIYITNYILELYLKTAGITMLLREKITHKW